MKKILTSFSYLFHPVFTSFYGCLLYFALEDTSIEIRQVVLVIIQVIIITLFVPIAFYYLLKSVGKIESVMASKISERKFPLVIQAFLLFLLIKDSIKIDYMPGLYYFFVAGFISSILSFFLLFLSIKASLHLVGISALTFFIIGISIENQSNYIALIAISFVLIGFIAASRLEMKAHTIKELMIGFLVGMLPQIAIWKFWL